PRDATHVVLASAKSVSSVAAQNTGATGTPVAFSIASASASTPIALDQVYVGPADTPGCCPVVTTTPWAAAFRRRSAAGPSGAIAGHSALSQSAPGACRRTSSMRAAHA